jgi:carotenoid cleavage dioxygenase
VPGADDRDSPANTHVIRHANRILALCEAGLPYELTRHLDTMAMYDFGGRLVGPMTAHPKIDPVTGELVFFGYGWVAPFVRYHVAEADGTITHSVEIEVKGPTMMHDCAVTATRTVLLDLPVCFDPEMIPRIGLPYRFRPEYGARIGILPRRGDNASVTWFEIEPCYIFHALNAYDEGARVVLEAARYATMFQWSAEADGNVPSAPAVLQRYTLDLDQRTVTTEVLDDLAWEFPRVDDRRLGRRHRYAYGVGVVRTEADGLAFRHLVRYDLQVGQRQIHRVGLGDMNSEPVFVPAGPGEGEGYVLSTVYNAARRATDVVIIDASRFTSPPVATIRLPVRVPMGFHGTWMPEPVDA